MFWRIVLGRLGLRGFERAPGLCLEGFKLEMLNFKSSGQTMCPCPSMRYEANEGMDGAD